MKSSSSFETAAVHGRVTGVYAPYIWCVVSHLPSPSQGKFRPKWDTKRSSFRREHSGATPAKLTGHAAFEVKEPVA